MRIVCRRENTPLVAIDVFVRTGVAQETAATAGLSNFVARTLLLSTSDTTPEQMQEDIGALGGNVSTTWQPEWTQINALTVRDQFKARRVSARQRSEERRLRRLGRGAWRTRGSRFFPTLTAGTPTCSRRPTAGCAGRCTRTAATRCPPPGRCKASSA